MYFGGSLVWFQVPSVGYSFWQAVTRNIVSQAPPTIGIWAMLEIEPDAQSS